MCSNLFRKKNECNAFYCKFLVLYASENQRGKDKYLGGSYGIERKYLSC